MQDPVVTGCKHSFCRVCILKAIASAANNAQPPIIQQPPSTGRCPLCRQEVVVAELVENGELKEELSQYAMTCTHGRCTEEVCCNEWKQHDAVCRYAIVQCAHSPVGCEYKGPRGEMYRHTTQDCPFHAIRGFIQRTEKRLATCETQMAQMTAGLQHQVGMLQGMLSLSPWNPMDWISVLCIVFLNVDGYRRDRHRFVHTFPLHLLQAVLLILLLLPLLQLPFTTTFPRSSSLISQLLCIYPSEWRPLLLHCTVLEPFIQNYWSQLWYVAIPFFMGASVWSPLQPGHKFATSSTGFWLLAGISFPLAWYIWHVLQTLPWIITAAVILTLFIVEGLHALTAARCTLYVLMCNSLVIALRLMFSLSADVSLATLLVGLALRQLFPTQLLEAPQLLLAGQMQRVIELVESPELARRLPIVYAAIGIMLALLATLPFTHGLQGLLFFLGETALHLCFFVAIASFRFILHQRLEHGVQRSYFGTTIRLTFLCWVYCYLGALWYLYVPHALEAASAPL